MTAAVAAMPVVRPRMPKQIAFIVGNEACERFSFYGMQAILTMYMTHTLRPVLPSREATVIYHLFVTLAYLLPLVGGWLADHLFGKYKTIFWLSLVYCAGHGVLAMSDSKQGLFAGLFLIAVGTGGIKPCVSSFVGDQFNKSNKSLLGRVYDLFYFSINFGSFFSKLLTPWLRAHGARIFGYAEPGAHATGPGVEAFQLLSARIAFAVPGILMLLATIIFLAGSRHYTKVPPTGRDPESFGRVVTSVLVRQPVQAILALGVVITLVALLSGAMITAGGFEDTAAHDPHASFAVAMTSLSHALDWTALAGVVTAIIASIIVVTRKIPFESVAREAKDAAGKLRFSDQGVDAAMAALRVMGVFVPVLLFWALYDQQGSTWVLQAQQMDLHVFGMTLEPDQISAVNPIMVMGLIPIITFGFYPLLKKLGWDPTPLRRMALGMFVGAASFLIVGFLQIPLDAGHKISVGWQLIPYLVITIAEVFVSITALEFAYSQAPRSMKSSIMSFWFLTISLGDLVTAYVEKLEVGRRWVQLVRFGTAEASQYFLFTAMMVIVAVVFSLIAKRYKVVEYFEDEGQAA